MNVIQNIDDYIVTVEQINNMVKILSQVDGRDDKLLGFIKDAGVKNYERAANSACKLICLYIELFTSNMYNRDFTAFIIDCVSRNHVRARDFYLLSTQQQITDSLYGTAKVEEINDYNEYLNFVGMGNRYGTVRIVTGKYDDGTDKKHSIISFSDPATRMPLISDTGRRGIHVDAKKFIDKDNFLYFTHIEKGVNFK